MKLIDKARENTDRIALISEKKKYSYQQLLNLSENAALNLLKENSDLRESRIAFLCDPGINYTAIQWGIWRAGGVAVPLCVLHPQQVILLEI